MSRNSFIKGAFILALGSLISRGLGAVYRIFLPYVMGGGTQAVIGIGLFNYAYPLYIALLGVSATGIPSALAKLVAENQAKGNAQGVKSIFRFSLWILGIVGFILSVALFLVAPYYSSTILKDERAVWSIQAIAPAIFLVSVMSAYRGYFQGLQNMVPHAVSQVVEQVARIGPMFILAWLLLPYGVEYSAAGATFGAVTGAVVGLAYLIYVYYRYPIPVKVASGHKTQDGLSFTGIFKDLMALAIPISLVGVIMPLMNMIDSVIVPAQLHAIGFDTDGATALYGILTGIAMPFIVAPTVITTALATSLIPSISEALATGDRELVIRRAETGTRMTIMLVLPAAMGLLSLAKEIPVMFYGLPEAGLPLAVLSLGALFLGLQQTSSSILQGMGLPGIPMKNLLVGSAFKLVLTWFLTAVPLLNINGAAAATSLAFLITAWLNHVSLDRRLNNRTKWAEIVGRPLLASLIMLVVVRLLVTAGTGVVGLKILVLAAIALGALTYGFTLLITGGITRRDVDLIPVFGRRAGNYLERLRLLRK